MRDAPTQAGSTSSAKPALLSTVLFKNTVNAISWSFQNPCAQLKENIEKIAATLRKTIRKRNQKKENLLLDKLVSTKNEKMKIIGSEQSYSSY